jgi:hypothetical protein
MFTLDDICTADRVTALVNIITPALPARTSPAEILAW